MQNLYRYLFICVTSIATEEISWREDVTNFPFPTNSNLKCQIKYYHHVGATDMLFHMNPIVTMSPLCAI